MGGRVVAAALVLWVAACEVRVDAGAGVEVEVTAAVELDDARLATVSALHLETSGGAAVYHLRFSTERRLKLVFRPTAASGELTLAVTARDPAGVAVGFGRATVTLRASAMVPVTVQLGADVPPEDLASPRDLAAPDLATADLASGEPDLSMPDLAMPDLAMPDFAMPDFAMPDFAMPDFAMPDFAMPDFAMPDFAMANDLAGSDLAAAPFLVLPPSATLYTGGTQVFSASLPVFWSVKGNPPGAKIDGDGRLTTTAAGSYTVVASDLLGDKVEIAVTVADATLSRIAGPLGGIGNLDGIGDVARFQRPQGVCFDGVGHLFVSDTFNHTIRKIDLATAAVTTLAGLAGVPGSDDGVGANARFDTPRPVACNATHVYVGDGSSTIRRVEIATRVVTTIAGVAGLSGSEVGNGSAAHFFNIDGLALDGAGNLWIGDGIIRKVRKLELATGDVTNVVGNGDYAHVDGDATSASFRSIGPMTWRGPAPGILYFSDISDHCIRAVDLAANPIQVTTLAGSLTNLQGSTDAPGTGARFNNPAGLALVDNGSTHAIFVGDNGNRTVRRIDFDPLQPTLASATTVSTPYGAVGQFVDLDGIGTASRFASAWALASDGSSVFTGDLDGHTVRRIDLSNDQVSTLAGKKPPIPTTDGNGALAAFGRPIAVAAFGSSLYVADDALIREVGISSGDVLTLAGHTPVGGADGNGTLAGFDGAQDLVSDGAGALYIADKLAIRKLVISSREVSTVAGQTGVASLGGADGNGTAASFYKAYGLARDGNLLYVADGIAIRRVDTGSREVTTIAGSLEDGGFLDDTGTAARFSSATRIALDGAGNAYVIDSQAVRRVVLATGEVTTVAGYPTTHGYRDDVGLNARFDNPSALQYDGALGLLVSDNANHLVRRVSLLNFAVSTVMGVPGSRGVKLGPLPTSLNTPAGIAVVGADLFLTVVDGSSSGTAFTSERSVLRVH